MYTHWFSHVTLGLFSTRPFFRLYIHPHRILTTSSAASICPPHPSCLLPLQDDTEFRPVQQLLEVDGERFVAVTVKVGYWERAGEPCAYVNPPGCFPPLMCFGVEASKGQH